tara:strand:+ start:1216 stop:4872 length:3657 start_codon:yes stop_codon:yes gene_type:complete
MKILKHIFTIVLTGSLLIAGTDGTIRGRITDDKGEGLPGTQVYIPGTSYGTMTDGDGNYILLNLPVGEYDVTFAMIGYKQHNVKNLSVVMDQTQWLNVKLQVESISGEEVVVEAQRDMVEHDVTGTKQTVSGEAIKSLPLKDVSELYSLQSGVVKVESRQQGIPGHEERGLEEVHVRGGRSGEIAYMIDGMYIKNPVFGGIGNGTRLNLFAVREFDFQPGGFSAEYGDAMSAVANYHTAKGGDDFSFKFKYETSELGSEYDRKKAYNDYNFGLGGRVPIPESAGKLFYWMSGQMTSSNYKVLEFDDNVFNENDKGNSINRENLVQPFDDKSSFQVFGFENVNDIFTKITYNPTNKIRTNFSYWQVNAHRKRFDPTYQYWNEGQNELFRDTKRFYFEFNHSLSSKTFYNLRLSRFQQDQFQGVRWADSDGDGYPDWFEWQHAAGNRPYSDPYDADVVPYEVDRGNIVYTKYDDKSGWYMGAKPGKYDWSTAEDWEDDNGDGIWEIGESFTDCDVNSSGTLICTECHYNPSSENYICEGLTQGDSEWNGPTLLKEAIHRDGSTWLLPDMFVNYNQLNDRAYHQDELMYDTYQFMDEGGNLDIEAFNDYVYNEHGDSLYYFGWNEFKAFGGSDYYYNESSTYTNELKFDITSQITNRWKARLGLSIKSHLIEYYEVQAPYRNNPITEDFSEDFKDFGSDRILAQDYTADEWLSMTGYSPEEWLNNSSNDLDTDNDGISDNELYQLRTSGNILVFPDAGENNGIWDYGEDYFDLNNNKEFDRGREPEEISFYLNNTIEVPWMVINAGARVDIVNYNTRMWSDPNGNISPYTPYFYLDANNDGNWDKKDFYDYGCNGIPNDGDYGEGNGSMEFDESIGCFESYKEPIIEDSYNPQANVLFANTSFLYKISPRLGFSHVITDKSNFTFNYGVYYQNPIYRNVFINTGQLENPNQIFEQSVPLVGNAGMTASRSIIYEFGVNVQVGRNFAYSVIGWAKDMDQMLTTERQNFGVFSYNVFRNYDYGSAKGIDLNLEQRGNFVNTMLQYTYSIAKANRSYDWEAYSKVTTGEPAPTQEYLQSYDRTHDIALTLYTVLPYGVRMGLTGFYQSGYPYTPIIYSGNQAEQGAKNSERSPSYRDMNLTFSKYMSLGNTKLSLGASIYNLLDIKNALDIYYTTGDPLDPGPQSLENVGLPVDGGTLSNSYYDTPWRIMPPRQINFHIKLEFN